MARVFRLNDKAEWERHFEEFGEFRGGSLDVNDGFIHLSQATQVKETATVWLKGQENLIVACIDTSQLSALRFEPSRGGALFPHQYGTIPKDAVVWVKDLPLTQDKTSFVFPHELQ